MKGAKKPGYVPSHVTYKLKASISRNIRVSQVDHYMQTSEFNNNEKVQLSPNFFSHLTQNYSLNRDYSK